MGEARHVSRGYLVNVYMDSEATKRKVSELGRPSDELRRQSVTKQRKDDLECTD